MVWLDRIGLCLEFLAFVFAAPELLGQAKLAKLHRLIQLAVRLLLTVPIGIGLVLIASATVFRFAGRTAHSWDVGSLAGGASLLALSAIYLLGGRSWLARFVQHLENDESLRRNFLVVGAVSYFLGFTCQLLATFK